MAQQHKLLRSQKNQVFEALREMEFDVEQFEWVSRPAVSGGMDKEPALAHKPSDFFFQFGLVRGSHYALYSPGQEKLTEAEYPGSWSGEMSYLYRWLGNLKRETEAPDLWQSVQQEKLLVEAAASSQSDNRPFTKNEVKYISGQLRELKEFIFQTQQLSSEQHEAVEMRLNYLAESASRQTRTDWLHTLTGVLLSLVLSLAMSSDGARELFRFAGDAFRNVLVSGTLPALP